MTDRPPMTVEPVTLEGDKVRLEPLSLSHVDDLAAVGEEDAIWRYMTDRPTGRPGFQAYVEGALKLVAAGQAVVFATIDKASGKAIGSTRFANIDRANRRLEIGWTWIAPGFQRSPVNTQAKFLQLRHCFETLGCIRVELKTDSWNEKSRNAIARLGAKQEGVFRNHMIMPDGRLRHTVWFSIIDTEWAEVRAGLEARMAR